MEGVARTQRRPPTDRLKEGTVMTRPLLVIATGNAHKIDEMRDQLSPWFRVAGLPDDYRSPAEDGDTFAANAYIKAQAAADALGALCLADDSGICVDYLNGAPGIHSARYAGRHGDDEANNNRLLEELEAVPDDQRTARFVCALSLASPEGELARFEGTFEGRVGHERRGERGFGYDPLFVLAEGVTAAELSADEKRHRSHRGQALSLLAKALENSTLYKQCIAAAREVE